MTSATRLPPATGGGERRPDRDALLADLNNLPAQRGVLLQVVRLADDEDSSSRALGTAASLDPAFAARLLRLANSAYYGRASRVSSIPGAVVLLGRETVRGLAVTMALGLTGEHGPLPADFWEHATSTAAGSQLLAPAVGASPGDAFSVGLLHGVGRALLFRAAPTDYAALCASHEGDDAALPVAERQWCGVTSGELGAAALAAAGLPESICRTLADHQADDEHGRTPTGTLGRSLRGGVLLARAASAGKADPDTTDALIELTSGGLTAATARGLVLRTAAQAAALATAVR